MYEYAFIRCPIKYKAGKIDATIYQSVIEEHAAQGWRLVQILVENPAAPVDYVVIFEQNK
jgi:hypothetical protein